MGDNKQHSTNKNNTKGSKDIILLVEEKIRFFQNVIQKTLLHIQRNKMLDILGINEVNNCIECLGLLSKKIQDLSEINNTDNLINHLQLINNELSSLFKIYGTANLEDLLIICFGNNNKITLDEKLDYKLELLKKYFHPISYKLMNPKDDTKQKKNNNDFDELENLNCNDISTSYKQFHIKVYGIKLFIYSPTLKKSLQIFGILDDIIVDFLDNKYINEIKNKTIEK